jgi:hypothetical protein
MNFVPIFTKRFGAKCMLWAAKFPGERFNEFIRLIKLWNDPEYLRVFLKAHEEHLRSEFWKNKTVNQAIVEITEEVQSLLAGILEIEEAGQSHDLRELDKYFTKIYSGHGFKVKEDRKGKFVYPAPYLRLYGFLMEEGQFVITGGCIKLTEKNQQAQHIMDEMTKLGAVQQFISDEQIVFLTEDD